MKKKVLTVLSGLLVTILFSALCLTGCGGGSFTSVNDLVRMAPQDTQAILFIDFKKLGSDSDFSELYEDMKASFESDITTAGSGYDFMNFEDIHYLGLVQVNNQEVVWINGALNLNAIRAELENEYDKDDYQGVEIWYGFGHAVAIHNGALIIGDENGVEESIEAIIEPERSAYEANEDVRGVVDKLSSGLFSVILAESFYQGSSAVAMTFLKINSDVMKFTGCFVFDNEGNAEDAVSDIESDMELGGFAEVASRRSGNFVEFSAEVDIEDSDIFW
jgi:hypothetical protein